MKLDGVALDVTRVDWVDNIPELGDFRVKVAAWENSKFRKLQQSLIAAIPRNKRLEGRIDPDEMDRVNGICLVETVVQDWENAEVAGQLVSYSKEQCREFVMNSKWRVVRDGFIFAAQKIAAAIAEEDKAIEKNLPGSSSGSGTGASEPSR